MEERHVNDTEDIFASALMVERDSIAAGHQQGKLDGMKQGYYEGAAMGDLKGTELGREVAFYVASTATWERLIQAQEAAAGGQQQQQPIPAKSNSNARLTRAPRSSCSRMLLPSSPRPPVPRADVALRALRSLSRVRAVLSSSAMASPLHPGFFDALQSVRTKYKQLLIHLDLHQCMRRQAGDLDPTPSSSSSSSSFSSASLSSAHSSSDIRAVARAAELSF